MPGHTKVGGVLSIGTTWKVHEDEFPAPSTAVIVTVVVPTTVVPGAGLCVIVGEAVHASLTLTNPV